MRTFFMGREMEPLNETHDWIIAHILSKHKELSLDNKSQRQEAYNNPTNHDIQ